MQQLQLQLLLLLAGGAATAAGAWATAGAGGGGVSRRPAMGWRSWNSYGTGLTQAMAETVAQKLAAKRNGTSLLDLGFVSVGVDDGWQDCGAGWNGTFHAEDGSPLWNRKLFPDPVGMVSRIHELGVEAAWYMNNCMCAENGQSPAFAEKIYRQSVAMVAAQGWDGLKLDGCGQFRNLSHWAALLREEAPAVLSRVENCNNQPPLAEGEFANPAWSGGQCPFAWFRSSGDITAHWETVMHNLAATVLFLNDSHPLSWRGCLAYPDMLEVANLASAEEDRSHFHAWCIISSPLILGYAMGNDSLTEKVWGIISNREAIAVNQQFAEGGGVGRLVKTFTPQDAAFKQKRFLVATACDNNSDPSQQGFSYDAATMSLRHGGLCADLPYPEGSARRDLQLVQCNHSRPLQRWRLNTTETCQGVGCPGTGCPCGHITSHDRRSCFDVWCGAGLPCGQWVDVGVCNGGGNQRFWLKDGRLRSGGSPHVECLASSTTPPQPLSVGGGRRFDPHPIQNQAFSIWEKRQPGGASAVLVLSNQDVGGAAAAVTLELSELNPSWTRRTTVSVRDIAARRDAGTAKGKFVTDPISGHDSRFYLLKPTAGNGEV